MRTRARMMTLVAAAVVAGMLAGCTGGIVDEPLKPTVKPPAIGKAGVLRAAVDLSYPPFAGQDGAERAGLDIDVAGALADSLGLRLELVDAKPEAAAAMAASGTVDVVLGGMPIETALSGGLAFAGTYISDAPATFSSGTATYTIADLTGKRVAVQRGSYAYWTLVDEYGEEAVVIVPTLRDALKAASSGQADLAAGDALVGAYLLRDFPTLTVSGQLAPSYPLGVGVARDKPELETKVRAALDRLAATGVLGTLRGKWFGDLPPLQGDAAADASATPEATATP